MTYVGPLDLFSRIVDVHFGSGPWLVVYATNGQTYAHIPGPIMDIISSIRVVGAPFSMAEPICPSAFATGVVNPDGSGSFSLTTDSGWRRVGDHSGGSPVLDIVAKNAAYTAWLGQFITTAQFSMAPAGAGGGIMFWNIDGYMVVDLSKIITKTLAFDLVADNQAASLAVAAATWDRNTVERTVLDTGAHADSCLVTLPAGVDIFDSFNGKPAHAVDYATKGGGGSLATSIHLTVDTKTLKVTCN